MQSKHTQTLIQNLEKFRIKHNLTQAEFAKRLKTSKTRYTNIISGNVDKISADSIKNIYDATGYLCFELMEIYTDDFLKLIKLLHEFSPSEIVFMKQFVEVYLESKGRLNHDD